MARKPRFAPSGLAYHVMNRTWQGTELFEDAADYEAFERVLAEALLQREKTMGLCAYCLMPNHFHLVLLPAANGQQGEKELAAIRISKERGRPCGGGPWTLSTSHRLGIESSLRPVGRPSKKAGEGNNGL